MTFLLFLSFSACIQIESYPEEPEITFKSFEFRDSIDLLGNRIDVGVLQFDFVDGDGDIGFLPDEVLYDENGKEYNHNCFLSLYTVQNGIQTEVELSDSTLLYFRIPFLQPQGQNPTLKGVITLKIEYLYFNYDTVLYEFFLMDRAFNNSNIERTTLIPSPK